LHKEIDMIRKEYFIRYFMGLFLSIIFSISLPPFSMAYEKEIKNLSSFMAGQIATAGKKTIAVVDFTDLQGSVTELGRFFAEEFSVALAGAGKGFEVVDRTHLKSIIAEHKLSSTGIIDPRTARKLGKIAGVGALITGTITPFGDTIRLSVKVLDTETAKMISASTGNIAKTDAIEELLARGIETVGTTAGRSSAVSPAPRGAGKAVEAEGFIFRPVRCKRRGGKLICTVSFFNNSNEERKLHVYERDKSYLVDNAGQRYPTRVKIGSKEARHSTSVDAIFVPQLPTSVNFITEQVNSNATHIAVAIAIREFKKLVVVRNIPITK